MRYISAEILDSYCHSFYCILLTILFSLQAWLEDVPPPDYKSESSELGSESTESSSEADDGRERSGWVSDESENANTVSKFLYMQMGSSSEESEKASSSHEPEPESQESENATAVPKFLYIQMEVCAR